MPQRGRKPKPTVVKLLQGNPGGRRLNDEEPEAPAVEPTKPAHLSPEASEHWDYIVPQLASMGLLAQVDATALELYCETYGTWRRAQDERRERGTDYVMTASGTESIAPWVRLARDSLQAMRQLLAEFGMTPSARSRIRVGKPSDDNDKGGFQPL